MTRCVKSARETASTSCGQPSRLLSFNTTIIMRKAPIEPPPDKKGHVCPPSCATHPRDRWESLFVFSFIAKFTQLRGKVEGLNSPMEYVNRSYTSFYVS